MAATAAAAAAAAACSIWCNSNSSSSSHGAGGKSVAVVVAAAPPPLLHLHLHLRLQHQHHQSLAACGSTTFLINPCRPFPRRRRLLKSNALSKDEQMAHPTPRLNNTVSGDQQGDDIPPSKNLPPFTFDLSTASSASGSNSSSHLNESSQVLVASTSTISDTETSDGQHQDLDRAINAMIVASAGAFAITKILTVDRDYWHGWTVFEILKYAPLHNWSAYEGALQSNPVLAKMMISGIVYSIGDWFAQCYEGKRLLDINRERIFRSGLVGFCLHGSLSHFYYYLCEFLFPFKDWWGVPIKVAFDQTIWSGFWNSVYFVTLGILRLEPPLSIFSELKATFWPMLSAGWKLWPFAHIITYGVIPVEQRLLWVDCVELIWVTILSMYSNEKAEARSLQESSTTVDVSLAEECTSKEEN